MNKPEQANGSHEGTIVGQPRGLDERDARSDDRETRLRQLFEETGAISSEASLDAVLQASVEVAARLAGARYAALGVLDRTGVYLERFLTTGIDDATRARIGNPPGNHGLLRVLLREARPVRVADVTEEPYFLGFPAGHPPMQSFLGVPIFVRNVVYGDLYLAEKHSGEFSEEDQELVALLAAHIGITIERLQIHEGAVRWIRQLEALDAITHRVLEERDLSRLLESVAHRMGELIGARGVLISLPGSSGGLRVAAADGEHVADLVGDDIPSDSKHARVFARGHSERVDSILEDPESNQGLIQRAGGVTAIFVPLMFQGNAIGIVSAFNKSGPDPRFTDHDLRLAEAFGARAALAVHLSQRVARETLDAILTAQEGERTRIARELHDETGSALTAILLGLAAIEGADTLPEARHASTTLRETARRALDSVGRLAFALRPAALDEFGLVPALRDLGRGLEEMGGPTVVFEVHLADHVRLPAELETALFRIAQEALTNVVKHAEAKTAHVILTCQERLVVLAVHDDGHGFSQAHTADGGFGLLGIRERVASLNGALALESSSGTGTRLTIEIPLT